MTVVGFIAVCAKITAAINAVRGVVDAATELVISVRKFVDAFGNVSTEIYYKYDSDGDGEADVEEVIYCIDSYIPDLNEPYQLVDKDGKIGLGFPTLRNIDSIEVAPAFAELDTYTSSSGGYRIALEGDTLDDVVYPLPFDFSSDGYPDFQIIVDDNDNGLPDACPSAPFYPIGSEGYQQIVLQYAPETVSALDKPFTNYSVSEALLFLIFVGSAVAMISKIFKRRKL